MRTRAMRRVTARYTWDRLQVSFWFAPAALAVAAVLLAWTMYWLDGRIPNAALEDSRFFLAGTPDDMRSALLNIAGTTLATAGVVFTLLTLPLSTVAAQYGSRLLRIFLGDRTTQLVLAMFVATFVYSISGALSILPEEVVPEAPTITATVGLYLMLVAFASLIVLIQHVSYMLQAPNIAAAAGAELRSLVAAEAPDESRDIEAQHAGGADAVALSAADGFEIFVTATGYIQAVDPAYLVTLAQERDLVIRMVQKPGAFVVPGTTVALIWPRARVNARLEAQVRKVIRLGNQRTPTQDVECAVNQLVEMAVRAMSPAINDPFTAMTCLDHLGDGLALFAQQSGESLNTYDKNGRLRLVFEPETFGDLLDAAFDMLRHASCDNASVLLRMLETIHAIGTAAVSPEARPELLRHISLIQAESQAGALIEQDRQLIRLRGSALQQELAGAPS